MTTDAATFWQQKFATHIHPSIETELRRIADEAETRRSKAMYNTGTVPLQTALCLRALCEWVAPQVVIEVGTFIGTSTYALRAAKIYTCDTSNDCLPATDRIETFPFQPSHRMLAALAARTPVPRADLCFFDGALGEKDAVLLRRLTHAGTVYAFDDYYLGPPTPGVKPSRKGVVNCDLLRGQLPRHAFLDPAPGTTLALLVPEVLL